MTETLQIVGVAITLIGAIVFAVASFGQMRAAKELEIGADQGDS